MSVIHNDDVRHQVKHYLDKINAKRAAKVVVTNDERARFLGLSFDATGQVVFPKVAFRKGAVQKSGAVRTSWPSRVK